MINTLQILSGGDIQLECGLRLSHPKLEDIKDVGEDVYNSFITTFCADPYDLMIFLYKYEINYEDLNEFDLFNLLFSSFYYSEDTSFRYLVGKFFKLRGILRKTEFGNSFQYVDIITNKSIITPSNFHEIKLILREITGYVKKPEETFVNKTTKEMYILDIIETAEMDDKNGVRDENSITLADLVGGVVLSTAYKYSEVWDLYLYQFHSCTRMLLRREEYSHIMVGIYSGNIDAKKISKDKIFWLHK